MKSIANESTVRVVIVDSSLRKITSETSKNDLPRPNSGGPSPDVKRRVLCLCEQRATGLEIRRFQNVGRPTIVASRKGNKVR